MESIRHDEVPPVEKPAAARPVRKKPFSFRRFFGKIALSTISGAAPGLARVGFIRNRLARSLERHVRESSLRVAASGTKPARVVEDRLQFGVTILRTIERAVAENRLSRRSIQRLLKNLAHDALLQGGEPTVRERFREKTTINPPEILLISPTKACNLRCKGCYADSTAAIERLNWPVMDKLVTELHDIFGGRFVVFSGGEPLVYRDNGQGVLDLAEKHPELYFMMYTNGTLIDDKTARRISEVGNVMPAISIEGLKEKTDARRGHGVFEKTLAAMDRLRNEKVFYGVSITATKDNVEEILSDKVIDFYFKDMGALFAWVFHYMPIGRAITLELMPTPEQRVWLWRRMQDIIRTKRLFIADFWNGGTASQGCIAGGRSGGYWAVTWGGDLVPCVFMPYSPININTVYAEGKSLEDVWNHPFLTKLRNWQYDYGYAKDFNDFKGIRNWMMPCPIRDHYKEFHPWVKQFNLKPLDENAREAVEDPAYYDGMVKYNEAVARLMDPIWNTEYLDPDYKIKND